MWYDVCEVYHDLCLELPLQPCNTNHIPANPTDCVSSIFEHGYEKIDTNAHSLM